MALFRLELKIIGRKAKDAAGKVIPGRQVSMLAKAAYRSGERLKDEQLGKTFDYRSRSQEVVHSEILTPDGAPDWMAADRSRLWNAIERVEKRKDSQLAREFIASLPVELNRERQIAALRSWCEQEFTSKGYVVDFAVHKSHDDSNPHAHILATTRPVDVAAPVGFGLKPSTAGKVNKRGDVGNAGKDDLLAWRASWCQAENAALEAAGLAARVDHRSLIDRGIDREPQPKIGPPAAAMERKGMETERARLSRWAVMENYIRPVLHSLVRTGEVLQHGAGATWWERAALMAARGVEAGLDMLHDQSSGGRALNWQDYVLRSRDPAPEYGRELEPG